VVNIIHIREEGDELNTAIETAMGIINLYPDIFPHMYKQGFKLKKRIKNGNLILQDGVVITFTQYSNSGRLSKKASTYRKQNDFIIHQIATDGNIKGATKRVMDEFVEYCKSKGAENILLTVRAANERARTFYERYGFIYDSDICWNSKESGEIKGVVYKFSIINDNVYKFI
jgi:RimJ/RimL family protein N-acetyltransferase